MPDRRLSDRLQDYDTLPPFRERYVRFQHAETAAKCCYFTEGSRMAKIICVLYDDPVTGYPKTYARDGLPKIERYPDGQTLPTPKAIDFKPGTLLGSVSGELGLRKFLESNGHKLVVTSSKDGAASVLDRELHDADIVISQPFWPAYMTAERIAKAPKLKMIVTAGIGSDHTDLEAAMKRGITVAEVTYCNSNSVAEHVVMMTLALVRNYIPSYKWVVDGGWNIADCVARSYDLEAMNVGTVAAGRIGLRVLRLLKPFDVKLHYIDRYRLPEAVESELNLTHHSSLKSLTQVCDVVTLNCPLHPETELMINARTLADFKRGAYLINTARGKLCDAAAVAAALESGQLAGYAGDVWFPQPPPKDHPWRTMPHHGMTPHISGTSLSAQARYAAGVREILECYFEDRPIRNEYLIVQGGKLAGVGAHSYSAGNATKGSEEAARFKQT
jgi:formate dehydrogenase